jgi:hypothetical protein
MRNVSEKNCRENQNTFVINGFSRIMRALRYCGKILYNRTGYKSQAEYVIFIAFPLQQSLHQRASLLRYTYIAWCYYSAGRQETV